MRLLAAALCGLLLAACGSTQFEPKNLTVTDYTDHGNVVVVRFGAGGRLDQIMDRYDAWERQGKMVIVDGRLVSADAFGALGLRRVCYTPRAVFGLHAASNLGVYPMRALTEQTAQRLPPAIRRDFLASSHSWRWMTWRRYVGDDVAFGHVQLSDIWPEGACSAQGVSLPHAD